MHLSSFFSPSFLLYYGFRSKNHSLNLFEQATIARYYTGRGRQSRPRKTQRQRNDARYNRVITARVGSGECRKFRFLAAVIHRRATRQREREIQLPRSYIDPLLREGFFSHSRPRFSRFCGISKIIIILSHQ